MVLAAFAANPGTLFLTTGILGKIVTWGLTQLFSMMASAGLVLLNVGASRVETLIDGNKFDGTWDSAEEFIKAIRDTGRDMTPEEIARIDGPVIEAFRKWGHFAGKKNT